MSTNQMFGRQKSSRPPTKQVINLMLPFVVSLCNTKNFLHTAEKKEVSQQRSTHRLQRTGSDDSLASSPPCLFSKVYFLQLSQSRVHLAPCSFVRTNHLQQLRSCRGPSSPLGSFPCALSKVNINESDMREVTYVRHSQSCTVHPSRLIPRASPHTPHAQCLRVNRRVMRTGSASTQFTFDIQEEVPGEHSADLSPIESPSATGDLIVPCLLH